MVEYNVNGKMKIVRHESRHTGSDMHESDVYERDTNGQWALKAQWTWRRVPGAAPGSVAGEHTAGAIAGYARMTTQIQEMPLPSKCGIHSCC